MASAEALAVGLPVVLTRTGDVAIALAADRGRVVAVDDDLGFIAGVHAALDALAQSPVPRRPESFPSWDRCAAVFRAACLEETVA